MDFGSLFSTATDWLSNNSSWLKPVANAGIQAYTASQGRNARDQYINALNQQNQSDYNYTQQYNKALSDYYAQAQQVSAANAAASRQAAAARAGAAKATEKNRQKAAKKANKEMQKGYNDVLGMYQPYVDTSKRLLPQMEGAYSQGLDLQRTLASFLSQPTQMAKLNQSVPAYAINVKLPGGN